jgi:Arc/MetJ family transcription regulator
MRTNIEIDDKLMADAQRLSGLPTKKAVVEEALRLFVQLRNQARIRDLYGKIEWIGDLDDMRRDKDDEAA